MRQWIRDRAASVGNLFHVKHNKPPDPPDPPGVTVPAWLVRATKFASWVATLSLMYFLWLYTLDIARDRSGALHLTHAGTWIGNVQFWFPYIVGFAIIAFGIPYVAKIAIPTFMTLQWRGGFWPKLWSLVIAMAVSLVVIAGTFSVQGNTLMERDREAAVAVEEVSGGRAAIQAEIDGITADLNTAMNNSNRIMAQAASVGALGGAEEWQRSYVDQARTTNDPRLPLLERATGAARAARAAVERRNELRRQIAAAPTVASVQGVVTTERTSWIADTLGWLEGARAILLSLVMDIVALMMPWIALRLEQARAQQMGVDGSGWADAAHRIEDLRGQDIVASDGRVKKPEPMAPYRETVTDSDTGEELIKVRPREYWRKRVAKKGQPTRVDITPDPLPDEVGVDAYATGRVALPNGEGVMLDSESAVATEPISVAKGETSKGGEQEIEQDDQDGAHDELVLDDEEAAALSALLDGEAAQEDDDDAPQPSRELALT